ncbi:paeninodin family lasso peptide [Bacillus sp. RO2]|nr:paeninodin family lasso peptide [Bacillus sp. RO2]NMH75309.1 paeninodin family lasso peptide [Bacillus sp. RO2]
MKCWTKPELVVLDVKHTMKGWSWKPPVHGNPGDDDCDPVVGES